MALIERGCITRLTNIGGRQRLFRYVTARGRVVAMPGAFQPQRFHRGYHADWFRDTYPALHRKRGLKAAGYAACAMS